MSASVNLPLHQIVQKGHKMVVVVVVVTSQFLSDRKTVVCVYYYNRFTYMYCKFHRNPFRGFGAPLAIPITLAIGYYNSLYYCN